MSQSQLVSILYICDSCRIIRKFDVSMDKLEMEGNLYKARDEHATHEAILYINPNYTVERVILNPPAPMLEEPIIKGIKVTAKSQFKGNDRIFLRTRPPSQMVLYTRLQMTIVKAMNGERTLGMIFEELNPDWPELTHKYLLSFVNDLEAEEWIREIKT